MDDDEAIRDSLDAYFTLKGMDVTAFASAQELLEYVEFEPSLLILDINMPDIDGLSLYEKLKERGDVAPTVLITGLGDPEVRERGERLGVAAIFDKPIDTPVLYSTIKQLLVRHVH